MKKGDFEIFEIEEKLETLDFEIDFEKRNDNNVVKSEAMQCKRSFESTFFELEKWRHLPLL